MDSTNIQFKFYLAKFSFIMFFFMPKNAFLCPQNDFFLMVLCVMQFFLIMLYNAINHHVVIKNQVSFRKYFVLL